MIDMQNARILIIDDQEANVLFLEGLLQQGGYRYWRSIRDPRVAAAECATFKPDLILLDLIMPGLDGFGVLKQLRPLLAAAGNLPVLMLTVDMTPESKRHALSIGAKDFLSKPLDGVEVLLRIKNLLEARFLYLQLQQRSDERIRQQAALIDQANDAIFVCDASDRIIFWNRGAESLYGYTATEACGRKAEELLSPRICPELATANAALASEGRWSGELPQVTRGGRGLIVASRWTQVRDNDGKLQSKLIICTDITEKKKTEEKLLRAQRLENIGRLAGGIAHDLNNMLTPLAVGVGLLATTHTDPDTQALLTSMQASLSRGADLVKQILTFSRGTNAARQAVDLAGLIRELARFFEHTFPRSITIRTAIAEHLSLIHADVTQMHQVLTNLCVNARDAMPNGGELRIEACNRELTSSEPDLPAGKYVQVQFIDTGTGIASHILANIFDPFFTTKEPGKGTGLGLATAQNIVRAHGGRITVESTVNRGTRFTILLPAREASHTAPISIEPREIPTGNGEQVLIVEDEEALLQITKLTLTSAGYRVLTAHDGAEAMKLYTPQAHDIPLVITDLEMPGVDGVATIHALQNANPQVRIIVISGLFPGAEAGQAAVAGVHAFLPKPYTVDALLATVRSVLDASS